MLTTNRMNAYTRKAIKNMLTKETGFADKRRTHKNTLKTENDMEVYEIFVLHSLYFPFSNREEENG